MHQFPILEILICDIVKRKVIKKNLMAILHRPYLSQKFSPQLVNKTFRNILSRANAFYCVMRNLRSVVIIIILTKVP